jgi:hypothetical protein
MRGRTFLFPCCPDFRPPLALLGLGILCDHSAVAMWVGARLAGAKLTLLSWSSTTSRTMACQYFFGAEFFFHVGDDAPEPMHRNGLF